MRDDAAELFKHQAVLLELARLDKSQRTPAIRRICEACAETMAVQRVSVWLFNDARTDIICEDMYHMDEGRHEGGMRLEAAKFPRYFEALETSRTVAANNAHEDPRTSEFRDNYLIPLGITSMMDVPIFLESRVVGVLCHEHTGPFRRWTGLEQELAGSLADMVSMTLETSERRRIAEALRLSEAHLRLLVEQLPAILYTTDRNLVFKDGLGTGLARNGLRPDLLVGLSLAEYLENDAPDDKELLAHRRALLGERVRYSADWSGRLFEVQVEPFRNHRGEIVGTLGLALDVTEQRSAAAERKRLLQAQQALTATARRRAAEWTGVLSSIADAVWVLDGTGELRFANDPARRLMGLKAGQELPRTLTESIDWVKMPEPGESQAETGNPIERALEGATLRDQQMMLVDRLTGERRFVRGSAAPIVPSDGGVLGVVVVGSDVTDRVEFERLKDEFIGVAAHELRTPVAIMKGYSQALLRSRAEMAAEQRRGLEAINRGANRIDKIVKDLLQIARLDLGRVEMIPTALELSGLVEELVQDARVMASRHHIVVSKSERVMVLADRERMAQVVVNLLDNAVKYSPGGGEVTVAVVREDRQAVVSVTDRGVGIPVEKQPRVFQRMYRAHTDTEHDYGGMGVGLYISSEIAAHHGGRLWFSSKEGEGSTFYLSLPLLEEDDGAARQANPGG